jgi:hypothetical protein
MYKVIGADQKEYGPVSTEDLRRWIAEGRANSQTKVKPEGATELQSLGSLPEFASDFAKAGPPSPAPPLPTQAVEAKTSGMAISSLVLGILGLLTCGITALIGLILGIVALVRVRKSQGRLSGSGLAIAGIIVSAVFILLVPVSVALTLPAFAQAKQKAQRVKCANSLKQLALAAQIYANDNKEQFPPASTWCDDIQTIVPASDAFQCPAHPGWRCAYALNAKIGDKKKDEVDPQTVLFFESSEGWNNAGGAELLAPHKHSRHMVNVAFADGTVRGIPRSQLDTLRWEP